MELPQQPPGSAHLSYTVGALTAIGGLAAAKRSKRSLAAGLFFGGAFVLAGYYISKGEPERGFRLGTVASGSLAGLMSYRFYKTGKFMPAGMLAAVGLGSGIYHGLKWKEFADV